jgi:hypothetical protein
MTAGEGDTKVGAPTNDGDPLGLRRFDIPYHLWQKDEPIAVLVGVHLHLEAFLIELIRRCLPFPDRLDLDRLNFPAKLGLALALGAIPGEASEALRLINSLRNRIAHNLSAELTLKDGEKLRASMDFLADLMEAKWDQMPAPVRIGLCAVVLQAWLNGFVHSQFKTATESGKSPIVAAARARYPLPEDSA